VVPNLSIYEIVEQLLLTNGVSLHEPSNNKHRCAVDKTVLPFGVVVAGVLPYLEVVAWCTGGAAEGDE
jgi:hypothetical protein